MPSFKAWTIHRLGAKLSLGDQMRKFTLAMLSLAVSTLAANATPIAGSYTVTSTASPTITELLANPFSFDLLLGSPQTFNLANIKQNAAGSSTITATFNFTAPVLGSGASVAGDIFTITGNARHDTLTGGATSTVNFSDGTILNITLGSAKFDGVSTAYTGLIAPVTFALVQGPTTREVPNEIPEPLTISIFGAGVVGAIAARRRKRQSA